MYVRTDDEIVQQYARENRLDELPPGEYLVTETVVLPSLG